MRAAVLSSTRPALELAEVPDPVAGDDQVVVEVRGCGICGSDLHVNGLLGEPGTILGHEIAGVVGTGGADVSGWRPGQPVAVRPFSGCGICEH